MTAQHPVQLSLWDAVVTVTPRSARIARVFQARWEGPRRRRFGLFPRPPLVKPMSCTAGVVHV